MFLDVDGTYADHGVVPPAHVAAVAAARAAGHRVFLCTGRPRAMLTDHLLAAGFDGVVASAGGYVEVDGQVLHDVRFPADVAARAVAVLDRYDAAALLEAPGALYGRPGVDERVRDLLSGHLHDAAGSAEDASAVDGDPAAPGTSAASGASGGGWLAALRTTDSPETCSFAKISYFASRAPHAVVQAEIGDVVHVLPSSLAPDEPSDGEIQLAAVHKAVGVAAVVEALDATAADVVAVGDGLNDLEMLEYAGTAVAVAGGDPRVLAAADHVTAPPAEGGVAAVFAALGLVPAPA